MLAEKGRALAPNDGGMLYGTAAVAARCASVAERASEADRHAARAVGLLKLSWGAGFPGSLGPRSLLIADHAFDAIRSREDFQQFLGDLPQETSLGGLSKP